MLTVTDFEKIRRLVKIEGNSQRKVARELGHSRKTIKKALSNAIPPDYCIKDDRTKPAIDSFRCIVDKWLEEDKDAPPKQRHTNKRIYERLCEEHGFTGSYSTVGRYINQIQPQDKEVYYPLLFKPGEEVQVDWGEAFVRIDNVLTKVYLFCMRLCFSKIVFVRAYPHMKMEAFLDGHVCAFSFFDGVPGRCAYDNLKTAVISVGRGKSRKLNNTFLGLRSHYLFETRFCNVRSGWEKGHVENLVKLAQRTFMTPVPRVKDFDELNQYLMDKCNKYREQPKRAEAIICEQKNFLPLPQAFSACIKGSIFASKQAMIQVDKCFYSIPVAYALGSVLFNLFVDYINIYSKDKLIATHRRSFVPGTKVLDPWHYVPLLKKKPGGIYNAEPFKEKAFGPSFEQLRHELEHRYDEDGTRRFIKVLRLTEKHSVKEVKDAVERCVSKRIFSAEAIEAELNISLPEKENIISLYKYPNLQSSTTGISSSKKYDEIYSDEGVEA